MLNHTKILSILLCVSGLSACTRDATPDYRSTQPYSYDTNPLYPEGYEGSAYREFQQEKKPVIVPESYHVGPYHSPVSHSDRDRQWVTSQNPQSYTIELADSDKASQVANTLLQVPKTQHTAEIQYQHSGKTYYKGLYGSYSSYEAAQEALKSLPQDVKQQANVKTWGTVQNNLGD